jgi:hypothetical protein
MKSSTSILTVLLLLILSSTPALAADPGEDRAAGSSSSRETREESSHYSRSESSHSERHARKVRKHKRRRNVLLGVGAVGLVTHTGVLTGIGLGGAAANEVIDHRHRDW